MAAPKLPLKMRRLVVVRASGVWNTRAPFHEYVQWQRHAGRQATALEYATQVGRATMLRLFESGRGVGEYSESDMDFAATMRQQTFGRLLDTEDKNFKTLAKYAKQAVSLIREWTVLKDVANFELFMASWCLNYLLARLEGQSALGPGESRLAELMSPIHGGRVRRSDGVYIHKLPPFPYILTLLPGEIVEPLRLLEYRDEGPEAMAALEVVFFWREFRNHCVHRGRVVSHAFRQANSAYWEHLRRCYPQSSTVPLRVGRALALTHRVGSSARLAHYQVAEHLNTVLFELTDGKRGHRNAPGEYVAHAGEPDIKPSALLIAGDHADSLEVLRWMQSWSSD